MVVSKVKCETSPFASYEKNFYLLVRIGADLGDVQFLFSAQEFISVGDVEDVQLHDDVVRWRRPQIEEYRPRRKS